MPLQRVQQGRSHGGSGQRGSQGHNRASSWSEFDCPQPLLDRRGQRATPKLLGKGYGLAAGGVLWKPLRLAWVPASQQPGHDTATLREKTTCPTTLDLRSERPF